MPLTTYWLAAVNLKQIKWIWETSDISDKTVCPNNLLEFIVLEHYINSSFI